MKKALLEVTFPGGKRVDAKIGKFVIKTDQPIWAGGEGSAPEPFQLFLASIATCAGIYAVSFCQSREISTEGMYLTMVCEWDDERKRYSKFSINLKLPEGFDEKYKRPIIRSMDLCAVKKHMIDPPEFEISAT
ncbi:MAG: OsmC family protein [Deltaproteobacteria bacterium]|nr:OsmC family protein [Deltaproteobacteria bacterium]MBW1931406.1 OsmC family protein [Deltaproteobacteria bacterium]MBW2027337.1 OsmC family protein [Deltaproteobacteria bacterium]MBW2127534.1 OsmC family protein [Deltaproteobacteria bacterium]